MFSSIACIFLFSVYCPFPGYIENGRVMLVGNMGVYDYRPYVRKVTNNKQIMYECERGYVLNDGPPGATCIGGRWSPKELPRLVACCSLKIFMILIKHFLSGLYENK